MAGIHGLPYDIVFVRHGQSEGNIASMYEDRGIDLFRERIAVKSTYDFRLTKEGVEQAKKTGKWIRKNIADRFDRYYSSDLLRAKETAAHLGFTDAQWVLETDIREQYLPSMRSSSSSDSSLTRSIGVEQFIDTLLRASTDSSVIVVCHATTIRSFMIRLENLPYRDLYQVEKNPDLTVKNCEVVWYSRKDPRTGKTTPDISWKTMVVPYETPSVSKEKLKWKRVFRPSFSSSDLLKEVEEKSKLMIPETKEELERLTMKTSPISTLLGDSISLFDHFISEKITSEFQFDPNEDISKYL
jgi:broad specificity phosphatase PhoE